MTLVADLVGFRFDSAKKAWLGAFFIGAFGAATANGAVPPVIDPVTAAVPDGHYELLGLDQIKAREEQARLTGDAGAYLGYATADRAISETMEGKRATPNDLPSDFTAKLFTAQGGELYKVIDPVKDEDWTEFQVAQKTAKVKAELVPEGTRVDTIMANGLHETSKTAKEGGGYRVTAQTGEQYLVDTAKFEKLYNTTDVEGVYAPKPDPRKVLPLSRNVAFTAPWGEEMRIGAGGVLVNGGKGDVYGIQPKEFQASYSFTPPKFA